MIAIKADNLGKRYTIKSQRTAYHRLRDRLRDLYTHRPRDTEEDRTVWAVRDVTFDVHAGHKVGIIGRNGAGKSTLLKLLARVATPTCGHADIYGRMGSLLEVGTGFHHELTGRQNIFLNGSILGLSQKEIEARLDAIIDFAELRKFIDVPVKWYSSGMYSRLAFSVAAHVDADILLVDEVLSVGDYSFQQKSLGKMNELTGAGRTVLFVSHNMAAVSRLCDRAILMKNGTIEMAGCTDDVIACYLDENVNTEGEAAWEPERAPGDNGVKLISVYIRPEGEEQSTPCRRLNFPVSQALRVCIKYRTEEPNLTFRCAAMFDAGGETAFASIEPREQEHERPGLYESSFVVPAHLLAELEYVLKVSAFSSRGIKLHYIKPTEALAFHAFDPMDGDSARGDYAERLSGLMRPRLEWHLESL